MYREKIEELIKWKKENNRSVLIIKGAPRTGKTWLLKEFGEKYYDKTIYIDLKDEANEESSNEVTNIKNLIEQKENEDIEKSIEDILKITEENKTEHLIILDNLEYNENAVNNLKKLLKSNRKFDIVASISKYGLALPENIKLPENKVKYVTLRPLNFREFLLATENIDIEKLNIKDKIEEIENNNSKYLNSLKKYIFIGGMPEVVKDFCQNKNYSNARILQKNILNKYEKELEKTPITIRENVKNVWNRIPERDLSNNGTWTYSEIREGAQVNEFEIAIKYLEDLGYIYRINRIYKADMPLIVYQDKSLFNLFYIDIGLFSTKMKLELSVILEKDRIFTIYKENLSEQYIMQELRSRIDNSIYCWKSENFLNFVNFVFQYDGRIYGIKKMIEVLKNDVSLRLFHQNNDINNCINITLNKYTYEGWRKDIPIYLIGDINFIKYRKI